MNTLKYLATLLFSAVSISGCATPYTPIPFDRSAHKIERIEIIANAFPTEAQVRKHATNGGNVGSTAASAHPLGLLVAVAAGGIEGNIASSQRRRIQTALQSVSFDGEFAFDSALKEALRTQGYDVAMSDYDRKDRFELVDTNTFSGRLEQSTAVFDIVGRGFGFQQVGGNSSWRPFVEVELQLIGSGDGPLPMMQNRVHYNPVGPTGTIVTLMADETYSFGKVEDIEANPSLAAEALTAALTETANSIAALVS